MRISITYERDTELYGENVHEKWRATFEDGVFSYDVTMKHEAGTGLPMSCDNVPHEGVPEEVTDAIDNTLEEALGR